MTALQASGILLNSSSRPLRGQRGGMMTTKAALNIPNFRPRNISVSNLFSKGNLLSSNIIIDKHVISIDENAGLDPLTMEKLYTILEEISDRIEIHNNIGEQRKNWNNLLLTSINMITLAATTMSALAATTNIAIDNTPLRLSSTLLFLGATGMLIIMNKIQPSQLVEEQRNAVRLFKQLENQVQRIINNGAPNDRDVKEAMEKVLALDKAFPLPLLGGAMLEKFPENVEPAVWWPTQRRRQSNSGQKNNGWNGKLEEEMRKVVEVIKGKDKEDYLRLGGKALKLNKLLAISGPLLTGVAALVGCTSDHGSWAAMLGIAAGALASVVNTIEHGGQVGMVFEMYRGNAGFFKLMEETIEVNLMEKEVERRENGELFEMKVALQLGRSLSELKDLNEEFASKLF